MGIVVKSHALPVYKKYRIASLLCIFESTITFFSKLTFAKPKSDVLQPKPLRTEQMFLQLAFHWYEDSAVSIKNYPFKMTDNAQQSLASRVEPSSG